MTSVVRSSTSGSDQFYYVIPLTQWKLDYHVDENNFNSLISIIKKNNLHHLFSMTIRSASKFAKKRSRPGFEGQNAGQKPEQKIRVSLHSIKADNLSTGSIEIIRSHRRALQAPGCNFIAIMKAINSTKTELQLAGGASERQSQREREICWSGELRCSASRMVTEIRSCSKSTTIRTVIQCTTSLVKYDGYNLASPQNAPND